MPRSQARPRFPHALRALRKDARKAAVPRPVPSSVAARKLTNRREELLRALRNPETNEIHLRCSGSTGVLHLRCDFVEYLDGQIWVSATSTEAATLKHVLNKNAQSLGSRRNPLRPAAEGDTVLVWMSADAVEASAWLNRAIRDAGADLANAEIDVIACAPKHRMRRQNDAEAWRRLPRDRRGPVARECIRCGKPLSDPDSVRIGIGPECQKHYSPALIKARRTGLTTLAHPAAKTGPQWWLVVQQWVSALTSHRSMT